MTNCYQNFTLHLRRRFIYSEHCTDPRLQILISNYIIIQDLHMKTKIEIRCKSLLGGRHHSPLTQRRMRRPWRWRPLHSARPPRSHHICPNSDSRHSSLGSRLSNTYQGGGYTATQPTFKQYAVPRILEAKSDDKTRYVCSSQDTHPNSKPRTAQLWQ